STRHWRRCTQLATAHGWRAHEFAAAAVLETTRRAFARFCHARTSRARLSSLQTIQEAGQPPHAGETTSTQNQSGSVSVGTAGGRAVRVEPARVTLGRHCPRRGVECSTAARPASGVNTAAGPKAAAHRESGAFHKPSTGNDSRRSHGVRYRLGRKRPQVRLL